MRILLIRHAPSMGQKDEKYYAEYGDANVPLDPERSHLSIKCGEFLKEYFNKTATEKWPLVWTSSYERAKQTYTGIKQGIGDYFGDQKPTWHVDPRLNEQSFGILPYIDGIADPEKRRLAEIYAEFARTLYWKDPFSNRTPMGEAPREVLLSVQSFIDGPFQRDQKEGVEDVMIVSHGAVMKTFIMNWFHLYGANVWKEFPTPGNCDVYVIEGERKQWQLHKIYDGEKALSLLDNPVNPIAHIKRPNELEPPPLPVL